MQAGLIAIAFNKVSEGAGPDENDILDQVELVEQSLNNLGYKTHRVPIDFKTEVFISALRNLKPDLVFNLTESIENHGELLYFAPALLQYLKIPYTGVSTEGIFLTTSKTLAKKWMRANGIPTADWFSTLETNLLNPEKTYLVKPNLEDGSLGFDEDQVFSGHDRSMLEKISFLPKDHFLVEEYIEGREFNISVLCGENGPEILPIAEIEFIDYPDGKPRIIGYKAKWVEESFEAKNTVRHFINPLLEPELYARLKETCLACWKAFDLKGYVRVDIRLDQNGQIYVLEINANPCISPGAGFHAACEQAGYSFSSVCERIIRDALA